MDSCTLSVLFPVRNIEQEIGAILRLTAEQTQGINTEFIVADMGSTDKTVWEALRAIKELRLSGSVLQSGEGTVARALNTAMVRAAGEYVSFVFARRLYSAFLAPYCEMAHMLHSDIVFGTAGEPFGRNHHAGICLPAGTAGGKAASRYCCCFAAARFFGRAAPNLCGKL